MVTMPQAHLVPGDVVAGKYRVARVIGAGAMGVVLEAEHLGLGHRVALKVLRGQVCEQPMALARFLREARAAVRIESDHVARVSDVGTLESGAPYMVMELLDGDDLASVLKRGGPLPTTRAVGHVLQACDAIAEAHSLGIVHRDLKPANLFLARRRDGSMVVKVIDFGISKASTMASRDAAAQTSTGAFVGSPLYMSPEQLAAAKDVDGRADVWSLGALLFELIVGHTPFGGETIAVVCAHILGVPAPPLRSLVPSAPEGLERVIARCLEKKPEDRMPNVAELAVGLLPFGPPDCRRLVDRIVALPPAPAPGALFGGPMPSDAPPPTAALPLLPHDLGTAVSGDRAPVGPGAIAAQAAQSAMGRSEPPPWGSASPANSRSDSANTLLAPTTASSAPPVAAQTGPGAHTNASWGNTRPDGLGAPRRGGAMAAIGVAALLTLGGLVSLVVIATRQGDGRAPGAADGAKAATSAEATAEIASSAAPAPDEADAVAPSGADTPTGAPSGAATSTASAADDAERKPDEPKATAGAKPTSAPTGQGSRSASTSAASGKAKVPNFGGRVY
jgi:serine/threonine protein kinase